jgi:hypothetical protein
MKIEGKLFYTEETSNLTRSIKFIIITIITVAIN